jgi:hypothetical protein
MAWTKTPRTRGRNAGRPLGNLHIQAAKGREQSVLPRCIRILRTMEFFGREGSHAKIPVPKERFFANFANDKRALCTNLWTLAEKIS